MPGNRLRLKTDFVRRFKPITTISRDPGNFCFRFSEICGFVRFIPPRSEGVRVVTDVGRGAMDAGLHHLTRDAAGGRQKRVVPISRRWDQPLGLKSPGGRWLSSPDTGESAP